jgi:hypothetical protein
LNIGKSESGSIKKFTFGADGRKNGKPGDWKDGRMEGWKVGRMEDWKIGRLEDWKVGRLQGVKGAAP